MARTKKQAAPTEEVVATTTKDPSTFVGEWHQLVSTTNWEKGRIIIAWREAATAQQAPVADYSDDAWARLVGGVSPQHVGRLRRVYERFGSDFPTYAGIYWSHFHAALDWPDAEMWLEGAVQNRWSVSRMRQQRWEAVGGEPPQDIDIIANEWNEDLDFASSTVRDIQAVETDGQTEQVETRGAVTSASLAEPAKAAPAVEAASDWERQEGSSSSIEPWHEAAEAVKLPEDLSEAMENLKLAILRHKMSGWHEVAREHVLHQMDGLRQLVVSD